MDERMTVDELIRMAEAHLDLINKYDPPGKQRDEVRDVERTWAMIAHACAATAQAKMLQSVTTWQNGMPTDAITIYRFEP